jgi:hypothetical protein
MWVTATDLATALKRLLIHASAFNLGLRMRILFGFGTPRALPGGVLALRALFSLLWTLIYEAIAPTWTHRDWPSLRGSLWMHVRENATCTTRYYATDAC